MEEPVLEASAKEKDDDKNLKFAVVGLCGFAYGLGRFKKAKEIDWGLSD